MLCLKESTWKTFLLKKTGTLPGLIMTLEFIILLLEFFLERLAYVVSLAD